MAETDILNPLDWNQAPGAFNPNPSYGFSRKPANNRQLQRPRLGPINSRDVMNGGHIFSLSWVNTTLEIADRVTSFYHDFKDGYFTFIDIDGGYRHYVGRFTNEPNPQHTANGKYTIEGVVFEEIPTARMLQYPSDFDRYGHTLNVIDDYLKPRVALMQGAWVTQVSPLAGAGASSTAPSNFEAFNASAEVGDWAQTQYVGWGFRMSLRLAQYMGKVNIFLDGTQIVTSLDLSSGSATATSALAFLQVNLPVIPGLPSTVQLTATSVPLDIHRVKIYAAGVGSGVVEANSPDLKLPTGGSSIVYPALEYIY